jgi:hypothetical protein
VTIVTINCVNSCSNKRMNIRHVMTVFSALAIAVSTAAFADEIYKWTDEDGNVHYEDRPSGAESEERLQFSYNRTDSSAVQARVQTQRDATSNRRQAREDAAGEKQTAAENRVADEEKQAQCKSYRAQLKTMLESPRVYREGASGERNYLDEAARAEARSKAEELIKETCGN